MSKAPTTIQTYTSIELFAGAGGLALGLEKAGFHHLLLNEIDKHAAATLQENRPNWKVLCDDIKNIDFSEYKGVDVITGGFPCQAFSYAGKKRGLEDTRGTLFYEFARALKESDAKVFLAENVRGLLSHDGGKTIQTIISVFEELGYHVYAPKLLKAIYHDVPQKRERIFIVGVKKCYKEKAILEWPTPSKEIFTLKDALKKGRLFSCDVPKSQGQSYSDKKRDVLKLVPAGGCWRDLPDDVQKEYMQKSFYLGGGRTGIARRISWDEPCLTLTCSPAQKQTERCHPDEVRPFEVREYARIQTFPDSWAFKGSVNQQYKQIGNAVPVNLSYAVGKTLVKLLDSLS